MARLITWTTARSVKATTKPTDLQEGRPPHRRAPFSFLRRKLLIGIGLPVALWAAVALVSADRVALAASPDGKPWVSIVTTKGKETERVETKGQSGKATYWITSPGNPIDADVTGPGRLRVLIRPEFTSMSAAAEEVHLVVSISGAGNKDIAAFSVPARASRYVSKPSGPIPGEVVTAFLDLPQGKHSIHVSSQRRVGIKLYISH